MRCALAARGDDPAEIRRQLWTPDSRYADAQLPELTGLAETVDTWWPAVLVFLQTGLTNARTNRLIKQAEGTACGFRNLTQLPVRVPLHCTRHARLMPARHQ